MNLIYLQIFIFFFKHNFLFKKNSNYGILILKKNSNYGILILNLKSIIQTPYGKNFSL